MIIRIEVIRKSAIAGIYIPQEEVDQFCDCLGLKSARFLAPFSQIVFTFDKYTSFSDHVIFNPGDRAIVFFTAKG